MNVPINKLQGNMKGLRIPYNWDLLNELLRGDVINSAQITLCVSD